MKTKYQRMCLILGDQLNAAHTWFQAKDPNTLYVLAELHQEQQYVMHHVQKICAFFLSMQNFAHALQQAGHEVLYLTLDDTQGFPSLPELIQGLCVRFGIERFEYQRPDEYRLLQQLRSLKESISTSIIINEADTEHFILPFEDISKRFKEGKHVRMENFYRFMRKETQILMEGDHPVGGQWNFDHDNRQSFTQQDLDSIPTPLVFANNVREILARLKRHQIKHFGEIGQTIVWPCSRSQARELLRFFCTNCLENFGRFQDAMTCNSPHAWSNFHSRLSFALNTKMIHPLEVIDAAVAAYHDNPERISIAQVEGFVRQILGWREYVRGMYWRNMPTLGSKNHLEAKRDLPTWFWTGKTKMKCMQESITQSLNFAYAHHIQRLMITGNFALISGLNPDKVDAWYLGIYIDAIEWVELPNTRGMALWADGGLIATKPYAASGNYISKMSDYCQHCDYKVKLKTGEQACPFNSLYWHFLHQHKERFGKNPRMAFPYKTWAKMSEPNQQALLDQANHYLNKLDTL